MVFNSWFIAYSGMNTGTRVFHARLRYGEVMLIWQPLKWSSMVYMTRWSHYRDSNVLKPAFLVTL